MYITVFPTKILRLFVIAVKAVSTVRYVFDIVIGVKFQCAKRGIGDIHSACVTKCNLFVFLSVNV